MNCALVAKQPKSVECLLPHQLGMTPRVIQLVAKPSATRNPETHWRYVNSQAMQHRKACDLGTAMRSLRTVARCAEWGRDALSMPGAWLRGCMAHCDAQLVGSVHCGAQGRGRSVCAAQCGEGGISRISSGSHPVPSRVPYRSGEDPKFFQKILRCDLRVGLTAMRRITFVISALG